ncbi:NUDIX hydrolase [Phaeodactylibacter luteus]|uniref:NUDIX hydrolase n=1 Tax=Phaeodactylibacter luteus TaxID=1564516 RepID=A0A5C6S1A1_9BACT|nr:NUDIX domain-containing protein [Phaeodactylibacter luteus]TXB68388.1 NUDIX hydrolase [Phaeodactylibacter luteus]
MNEFNEYFKSAFTVDNVIFGFDEGDLKVLLIKRGEDPYRGKWGLPGYFVYPNEDLDTAAIRVLEELTGLRNVFLEQVKTFGSVNRHPFGRVITVAYFSLIKISHYTLQPSSIARKAKWHSVSEVTGLAFDHDEILKACFHRLKWLVRSRPVGFELLPPKFTLTELQHLYEAILETSLDKRNFRKKILSMDLLIDLDETQEGVAHRPARLYQFDRNRYEELLSEGFSFELKESKKKERTTERAASSSPQTA